MTRRNTSEAFSPDFGMKENGDRKRRRFFDSPAGRFRSPHSPLGLGPWRISIYRRVACNRKALAWASPKDP